MERLTSDIVEDDLMPTDFHDAAKLAVELADKGLFHLSIELPNNRRMSVARFIRTYGLSKLINLEGA